MIHFIITYFIWAIYAFMAALALWIAVALIAGAASIIAHLFRKNKPQ